MARKGPHKVIFPPNLNVEGAIDLLTPDNVRLRSHVLGLCYRDMANGKRVVIGAVKDSQGELLMPNRVIYRDAFQAVTVTCSTPTPREASSRTSSCGRTLRRLCFLRFEPGNHSTRSVDRIHQPAGSSQTAAGAPGWLGG